MTIGTQIPVGRYLWTIVEVKEDKILVISEPLKSSAKSVFEQSVDLNIDNMNTCIKQTRLTRLVFYEFSVTPPEYFTEYFINKIVFEQTSCRFFLPGICDIFPNFQIDASTHQFDKPSVSLNICAKEQTDYTKLFVVPHTTMFRDLLINENGQRRCIEIDQNWLQGCRTNALPISFDEDWYDYDPAYMDTYYTLYDQERWLQLCCWIDIEKYKQLPRHTQIMGFEI